MSKRIVNHIHKHLMQSIWSSIKTAYCKCKDDFSVVFDDICDMVIATIVAIVSSTLLWTCASKCECVCVWINCIFEYFEFVLCFLCVTNVHVYARYGIISHGWNELQLDPFLAVSPSHFPRSHETFMQVIFEKQKNQKKHSTILLYEWRHLYATNLNWMCER